MKQISLASLALRFRTLAPYLLRLVVMTAVLLTLVSCGKKSSLREDGLYQADASYKKGNYEEKTFSYLRFYKDGAVVTVSSPGTAEQVGKWLAKGHQGVSEGAYKVDGQNLTFTTGAGESAVDYSGKIEGENLVLDSLSHSNQNKASHTYKFIKR